MVEIINNDFRNCVVPKGLVITDPPYNQNYKYGKYRDKISTEEYIRLLSMIPTPCVIIHYPEETINILPKAIKLPCEEVVCWVYNSNTGKQSRLISWWGCRPDFKKIPQPYKNTDDARVKKMIEKGSLGASSYDWWEINQIKNVSEEKTGHPCQIPEELIKKIIISTAKKGEKIIDVFAGSGTTNKAAKDLGFESVAYEIDEEYCKIIRLRTSQEIMFN